ncbi:deoxycytidyl transferase Ecym_5052 [Eremothecium cymbalariae DBVPG|uniref:DNA repair protein REV1 n=1 Tax=Eremothecium cymbalariae (strain CBS 270.75 / DBVPG 7215 / KCTC 17166 / NRRL Y-17582) TaxID=931890 RepID=I6NCQ1_ERECY|nr:hypothetical protein Ecym_5052 [Eremothecium cymbalariae DBVPG\
MRHEQWVNEDARENVKLGVDKRGSAFSQEEQEEESKPTTDTCYKGHDEDVRDWRFHGYGEYFDRKRQLQKAQDERLCEEYEELGEKFRRVFEGCKVYINGRTDPDREQLRKEIVLHGGQFVQYLTKKSDVTHIVAQNLSAAKCIEFRNFKVVQPGWIGACVRIGKMLSWREYSVIVRSGDQPFLELPRNIEPQRSVSCKEPGFVEDFFSKSRLHRLSVWKADLHEKFLAKYLYTTPKVNLGLQNRICVFHIDFDCFFATVSAIKYRYQDADSSLPLAVSHGQHNSDVASCNYAARSYGVRNGMWVAEAKKLCPNLVCLPYAFAEYESASNKFYEVLQEFNKFDTVLPISVDEALGVINCNIGVESCEEICVELRKRVVQATGCRVSIGCAPSLVLARLALKRAKPDGYIMCVENTNDELKYPGTSNIYLRTRDDLFEQCMLRDLPGVGRSTAEKLIYDSGYKTTIAEVSKLFSRNDLIKRLGPSTGTKLAAFLQGKDDLESRIIQNPREYLSRKSISAEINWGLRFDSIHEIDSFIDEMVRYLAKRLSEKKLETSQVKLKIMRRSPHAAIEPVKYLGMGECDSYSKSSNLGVPTDNVGIITSEIKACFRILGCPPKDLRGLSVQMFKLSTCRTSKNQQMSLPFAVVKTLSTPSNRSTKPILGPPAKKRKQSYSPAREFFGLYNKSMQKALSHVMSGKLSTTLNDSFLEALPTDIADELRRDHAICKKASTSYLPKKRIGLVEGGYGQRDNCSIHLKSNTLMSPVLFQGLTRPKRIQQLIVPWISETIASNGPNKDDLKLFTSYLDKLCSAGPARLHLIVMIAQLISQQLKIHELHCERRSFQEWEEFLLKVVTIKLNQCRQQDKRNISISFDF